MKQKQTRQARYYAYALFELAGDNYDDLLEDFDTFCELQQRVNNLTPFLTLPFFSQKEKIAVISKALQPNQSTIFTNFVCVLLRKKQIVLLPEIHRLYRQMADERARRVRAIATTAVAINAGQKQALTELLSCYFVDYNFVITNKIDPEIIGGVTIEVNDLWIDASLKGQLQRLHRQLLAKSRQFL